MHLRDADFFVFGALGCDRKALKGNERKPTGNERKLKGNERELEGNGGIVT